MLALIFSISACSDSSLLPNIQKQSKKQAISKIDGQSVINITSADLYHSKRLSKWLDKVAVKDGPTIIRALKKKTASLKEDQIPTVALTNLKKVALPIVAGSKAGSGTANLADVGSVLHVQNADGSIEKFVMTLVPMGPGTEQPDLQAIKASVSRDTYLALDPEFFYVHDNAQGKEDWPVTFPAVSMSNLHQKIMVTGYRKANGVVRYKVSGQSSSGSSGALSNSQPNLVFATATPIAQPNDIQPCEEGDPNCPPPGGPHPCTPENPCQPPPPPPPPSAPCSSVEYSGPVGSGGSSSGDTFFDLYKVHLWANGEGGNDDAAEVQALAEQNDDYGQCLPQHPLYDFDFRVTASYYDYDQGKTYFASSTNNYGANGVLYRTQDVNFEGQTYSFLHVPSEQLVYPSLANGYSMYYEIIGYSTGGFPLFDLTAQPGPWRLALNETDKSYDDFSVHEGNNHLDDGVYVDDIHTFNMSSGAWGEVSTGFTPYQFNHGNSDDPLTGSGARQVTIPNVTALQQQIPGGGQRVTIRKDYQGRGLYFKYVFGLKDR